MTANGWQTHTPEENDMHVTFPATLQVDEFEIGTTTAGDPYLCMRDATVVTEYETIQRTVMAFGDPSKRLASNLAEGRPIHVIVHESGRIMKVDEVRESVAA